MRVDRIQLEVAGLALALLLTSGGNASAQQELAALCAERASQPATDAYCALVVQAADILPGRVSIVAAGGNPVPGSPSTLGMSLGPLPRISANGRVMLSRATLPAIQRAQDGNGDIDFVVTGLHADFSVGVFSGLAPFATIGGVGAIDLIASAGVVHVPEGDGLNGENALTWGVGARLGITRESFTAPGISLSAMYRKLGELAFGDGQLQDADAFVNLDETALWSFRAVAGKRITSLSVTAGLGYDRYSADLLLQLRDGTATVTVRDEYAAGRWNGFLNGTFTMLVLSATAELGWQAGGEAPAGARSDQASRGALFAGFAIRLAI